MCGGGGTESFGSGRPVIWLSEADRSLGWNNIQWEEGVSYKQPRESGFGGGVYAYVCGIRLHSLSLTTELQLWDQDRLLQVWARVWGSLLLHVGGSQGGEGIVCVCVLVCMQVGGSGWRTGGGRIWLPARSVTLQLSRFSLWPCVHPFYRCVHTCIYVCLYADLPESLTSNNPGIRWGSRLQRNTACGLHFASAPMLVSSFLERGPLSAVLFLVKKSLSLFNNHQPYVAQTYHDENGCLGLGGTAVSAWH